MQEMNNLYANVDIILYSWERGVGNLNPLIPGGNKKVTHT